MIINDCMTEEAQNICHPKISILLQSTEAKTHRVYS